MAGLASDLPVKVDINLLEKKQQPKSETINLQKTWFPQNGSDVFGDLTDPEV